MDTQGRRLGQRMAAELRAEMGRQGRSRRWLADQIDESHVTVGRWIKGETPMSLDVLDSICRALGLTIADLLAAVERNGGYDVMPLPRRQQPTRASSSSGDGLQSDTRGYHAHCESLPAEAREVYGSRVAVAA